MPYDAGMPFASRAYDRLVSSGVNRILRRFGLAIYRTRLAFEFDYPPTYRGEPRWRTLPDGHQPHLKRLIEAGAASYETWFARILARSSEMRAIPRDPDA